jgi:hypothetical protein
VNAGELPRFGRDIQDCFFVPAEQPATAAALVVDLVARRLPEAFGFGPGEVQVLVPKHRGDAGVGALNALLQERLNPAREGVPQAGPAAAPTAPATACSSSRMTTIWRSSKAIWALWQRSTRSSRSCYGHSMTAATSATRTPACTR